MHPKYVYDFAEGGRHMTDLLGGKGAHLAEMTRMGLPVPPGFTVTTDACRVFQETGEPPPELERQIGEHLAALERTVGRRLGQVDDPLLLSVRSSAPVPVPGTMDTVLDIGLNDLSVLGLGRPPGPERFAWDSYRRLVQMFGSTVMGVDSARFESILTAIERQHHAADDTQVDTCDLIRLVETYKDLILEETGEEFPQDPAEQLRRAVLAVFTTWNGERARLSRRREHIPDTLGTAVTVQTMVFGNRGPDSGSGVAFTRAPGTGPPGVYGDYLPNAQGEDVIAGIRDTVPLRELEHLDPVSFGRLRDCMRTLESHYRGLCSIEFTIERGTLWMLRIRPPRQPAPCRADATAETSSPARVGCRCVLPATEGGHA
ncbi:hypothetical protein GCM10017752_07030 [Streptomyces roseoviridis]